MKDILNKMIQGLGAYFGNYRIFCNTTVDRILKIKL